MKKLTKLNLNDLKNELTPLTIEEFKSIIGGDGNGDCVYQAIAYLTGRSVSEIQTAYGEYHNNTYWGGAMSPTTAHEYAGMVGVNQNDLNWIMDTFGVSYADGNSQGLIIRMVNENVGHAVVGRYYADIDMYMYYDPQNNRSGFIDPYSSSHNFIMQRYEDYDYVGSDYYG